MPLPPDELETFDERVSWSSVHASASKVINTELSKKVHVPFHSVQYRTGTIPSTTLFVSPDDIERCALSPAECAAITFTNNQQALGIYEAKRVSDLTARSLVGPARLEECLSFSNSSAARHYHHQRHHCSRIMTFLIEDAAPEDFQAALTFVDEYESSSSELNDEVPAARHLAIRNGRSRKATTTTHTLNKTVKDVFPDDDELLSLGELDLVEIPSLIDQGPPQITSPFLQSFESPLLSKPSSLPVHLRQFRPVQPKTKKIVPAATQTTKNGKKPITWNPNKARNERKAELMYLRKQVTDLQHQLDNIQTKKPRLASSSQVHPSPPPSSSIQQLAPRPMNSRQQSSAVSNVWKALADRQREERVKSERENIRLKLVLEGQLKIAKSLEEILNKTTAPCKKAEECVNNKGLTHVYPPTADRSDYATFEQLLAGVDEAHSEIDAVFEANGLAKCEIMHSDAKMRLNGSNGIYLEVFRGKVLPFNTHATSEAVWDHFANPTERRPYRRYYEKSEALGTTEDSLVENFNMVRHANSTSAIFRVKRILRRYVEAGRIVVVWWAFIDPIELSEEPLTGVRFLEKGYILIKKPTSVEGDFSLLQSCYITTPVFTGEWTQDDHPQVGAITDFVLSSTESSISASHQMIEDVLLRQAMKTSGL